MRDRVFVLREMRAIFCNWVEAEARGEMGMRDGSFSHFSQKGNKEMGMRDGSFSPPFRKSEKWEKEPSLIPSFFTPPSPAEASSQPGDCRSPAEIRSIPGSG